MLLGVRECSQFVKFKEMLTSLYRIDHFENLHSKTRVFEIGVIKVVSCFSWYTLNAHLHVYFLKNSNTTPLPGQDPYGVMLLYRSVLYLNQCWTFEIERIKWIMNTIYGEKHFKSILFNFFKVQSLNYFFNWIWSICCRC